jgi:PAS domain S-box-containing protein
VDDWQWADAASLTVLRHLQINSALRYLLVLAAYRDNEVDPVHPFLGAVEDLRRQGTPIATLEVRDLSPAHINSLLRDTLVPAAENLEGLASFLQATTKGNPFFLRALVESLQARRELWFDSDRRCWCWNTRLLEGRAIEEDVVRLFVRNLQRLPEANRDLLALGACLGNRFDLRVLAMVSEQEPEECLLKLGPALEQRVILPLDGEPEQFRFQHDRVQQAAHTLIAPTQLPEVRLKIGRLLRGRLKPHQIDERLLEVTDHLNAGRALVRDKSEVMQLVELNIAAGRQARASTAYRAALQFHRVAGEFFAEPELAATFWKERHSLGLTLFKDWAESEFLEGDQNRAEACIREALAHSENPLEQAEVLCTLIQQNTLLARYPDAIESGRQALSVLGITLPEADYEKARDAEIALIRSRLAGCSISSLKEAPPMSNPVMLMITRVLITLGPPCYRSHQRLWGVIVPKVVDLTLQFGPVPQVGYSHTAFGGLLGWVDNDYQTAREFGELASSLMREVFTSPSDQSVFYLMIGSSTRHWFAPLRAASEDFVRAWETGLRSGNLQYAAYAFGHNMYCRFFQGIPLDCLVEETKQSLAFSRTRMNQWAIDLLEGGLRVCGALEIQDPATFDADETYLREVEAHQNIQVGCIYRVLKAFALLILNEPEKALQASDEAESLLYTVGTQGLLPWPEHLFARLLIHATLHPRAGPATRQKWRGEMDRAITQLEVWARHAPDNYQYKLRMAQAEVATLEHRTEEALELYEEALRLAQAQHFNQWEGWGSERAAELARVCGDENLAQAYWQNAFFAYYRWGAMAKVSLLEDQFFSRTTANRRPRIQAHLKWLREQANKLVHTSSQTEQPESLKELAEAAEHLREEVARRRQAESELQQSRDQLAKEMEARNRDLETTRELVRKSEAQARELAEQRVVLIEAQAAMLNLIEDATSARDRAERANASLRESERDARRKAEELQTLMDLAPLAICVAHDPDCSRITGNRTANALYEAEPHENVSAGSVAGGEHTRKRRFFQNGREMAPEELPMQEAVRRNAEIRGFEITVVNPSGKAFTILGSASPLRDESGQVRGCIGCFVDITGRKRVEEDLRASEEQFRAMFELASIGMAQADPADARLLRVNQKLCQITGYSEAELLRLGVSEITHPDDRAKDRELFEKAVRGETPDYRVEKRYTRKDGKVAWVNVNMTVIRDVDGHPLRTIATIEDITARKRAEARTAALATLGLRLNAAREPVEAARAIAEVALELFGWDAYFLNLYNRDAGEMTSILAIDTLDGKRTVVTAPAHSSKASPLLTRILNGQGELLLRKSAEDTSTSIRFGDKTRSSMSLMFVPVRHHGDSIGVLSIQSYQVNAYTSQDLEMLQGLADHCATALLRLQAEEQLRKLSRAVEQSPAVVVITDAKGDIEYVNPRFTELTGYTLEEVCGRNPRILKSGEMPAEVYRELWAVLLSGGEWRGELLNRRKNGELFWEAASISPIVDDTGKITHFLAVNEDITEHKRLERERAAMEAQMRQQQKIESIGTLASGVAHEINNPINGIMNYAQLIQDRLPAESPLIEFTGEIMHETQRVATIVRNLLTFARNEKQSHSPARIADIIEAVLSLVRAVIRHDQITLNVNVSGELPQLKCRSQQIQQVIMNLITNARDALNERYPGHNLDKVLNLEARLLEKAGRRWIRVTVEDHGTGIAPEIRERMFDPFFSTKGRDKGTGLGLSISHGIVKEHHGQWTVESELGKYTRMHVDLPVDNGWEI